MDIHNLISNPPKLHSDNGQLISDWKLADEELLFLNRQINQQMKTIETGAGVSTIAFAIKGTNHTCIVPDEEQVNRIKKYCDEQHLSYEKITFIIGGSEYVLPQILDKDFDLALIDGRHGFPTPFIDWFYLANLLKIGGVLIIDDIHIWTCELLMQILLSEKDWELLAETLSAVSFVKRGDSLQNKEYKDQSFIFSRSREVSLSAKSRYLLNLLKRGNYSLFQSTVKLGILSAISGNFGKRKKR